MFLLAGLRISAEAQIVYHNSYIHIHKWARVTYKKNANAGLVTQGTVEKVRRRRSRPFAALHLLHGRPGRQTVCGLAGRAFLNSPFYTCGI